MNVLVIVRSFPAHEVPVHKASTCRRLFSWLLVVIFRFPLILRSVVALCFLHRPCGCVINCIYCDSSDVPALVCFIACCRASNLSYCLFQQQRSKVRVKLASSARLSLQRGSRRVKNRKKTIVDRCHFLLADRRLFLVDMQIILKILKFQHLGLHLSKRGNGSLFALVCHMLGTSSMFFRYFCPFVQMAHSSLAKTWKWFYKFKDSDAWLH